MLTFCGKSFSQKDYKTIRVTYGKYLKSLQDKTDSKPRQLKDLYYVLLSNKYEARCEFDKVLDIDGFSNERFINKGGGKGVHYRNIKTKERFHQKELGGKYFIISENIDKYDWEITDKKKVISGYTCYKAQVTYEFYVESMGKHFSNTIIVWFTPDIPLRFGPMGYDGVPGLVLEAQTGGYYYIANKIEFLEKEIKIKRPSKGTAVTAEEYDEIYRSTIKS